MQSAIAQQEKDFEFICSLDAADDCQITRSYQTDWSCLNDSKGKGGSLQRDAWRKLRDKLDTYSGFAGLGETSEKPADSVLQTRSCGSRSRFSNRKDQAITIWHYFGGG